MLETMNNLNNNDIYFTGTYLKFQSTDQRGSYSRNEFK